MKNNHTPVKALTDNPVGVLVTQADGNENAPVFTPDTAETYDPADYRWVPVRRRPRYDGWTDEKQRRFIEVLADTGIVTAAAKAVGMTRESANRLRRSPHGAAFSHAWDAAREHAGSVLEDIAFERAIEGTEHDVFDEYGSVICTKRVYNDRLLRFLLTNLKPERYGRSARSGAGTGARAVAGSGAASGTPHMPTAEAIVAPSAALQASLRAMEPQLPSVAEEFLGLETLEDELKIAEIGDGELPSYLSEQRPVRSDAQLADQAFAAQLKRGEDVCDAQNRGGGPLSDQEFKDMCLFLDPTQRHERGRKRFR
jgi:hypothetical protein